MFILKIISLGVYSPSRDGAGFGNFLPNVYGVSYT